ncbi:MAG: PAS domain S-box protein [Pseudomonadota bacterium]
MPALLCVALFGVTVFWLVLPETEKAIMAKKKEMIRELSQTVLSLLASYEQQEQSGLLTRDQAQKRALSRAEAMRYGDDGRDYFWLMDTNTKKMLMHPYSRQLDGTEIVDIADPRGFKFFQAMFQVLEERGSGYVSYIYQYKDDPGRLLPKISYVARFAPWGWAVGTGVYNEDLRADMAKLTRDLTWAGLAVWLIVTLLGVYITMRNIKAEREGQATRQSLRESALRLRGISANALDGIVMIDNRQRITFWNKAAEDIFGYTAPEVLGNLALELLVPDRYHQEYLRLFQDLMATDQDLVLGNVQELMALDQQGREFPVEVSLSALNMSGQWQVVCVVRNITKRKQAEKALEESEKLYRALFEQAGDAIFLLEDGRFIDCNQAALRMFRGSHEKLIGILPAELSPSQQADGGDSLALADSFTSQARAGQALSFEWTHKRLDGSLFDAEVSLINIELPDKAFLLSMVRDISQRKRDETALKESEARLRLAQSVGGVGSYEIDLAARVVWGSEQALKIYGLEEYQDRTLPLELVQSLPLEADRPRMDQALELLISQNTPYDQEFTIRRHGDQQLRRLVSRAEMLRDAQGRATKMLGTVQDITERKLAEEEVKKSEATLHSILQASPCSIAMVSHPDRHLIWVNQRTCDMSGYSMDELLGMQGRQLYFDDEEYERVGRLVAEQLPVQGVASFQTLWRRKDGSGLAVLYYVSSVNPDNLSEGTVFTALDISERVRAEEEIRKSEATLSSILQSSACGIAQVSFPERRIIWANERLSEMTGHPFGELLGMSLRNFYRSQDEFDKAAARITGELAAGSVSTIEARWQARDGGLLDVLITVSPLNPHDLTAGVVSSVLDITEIKRAQELARRNEERYRLILEASPDPVVLYDMQGQVLYINPAFTRVFGWALEELEGHALEYVPPEERDKTAEILALLKQGQTRSGLETRRYNRQGDILTVVLSWSVWRDEDGALAGSVVVLRDVTEHKKVVAQLEQSRRMEAIGTLAGGIAHDFNNVLQAISGNVQILMMRADLDSGPRETLAGIDNLTQRAAEMIQQLLTISRKREITLRTVSLNHEIKHICRLLERVIPKMITLDLHLDAELWPINGDQSQLEQIILNLAGNAADAMPQGGTLTFQTENLEIDEVFCRTHPELSPGPHVLLKAMDTGQGMGQETLKHIFEPFYTTKQSGKGTGLGLSTIYGIVQSHMGLITCYSAPGQGTVFNLYFPALATHEGLPDPAPPELEESPRGGNETVLLVDDEADIIKVGSEILGMYGYQVLTAGSGEDALALYQQHGGGIDLVIVDLNMPGMGGQRCMEALLRLDPTAKVIISSGYYTHLTARELQAAGASGFIGKPYRLSAMVKRVREVLDGVRG